MAYLKASGELNQISPSLDRAASEMAIKRLKEELAELDAQGKKRLGLFTARNTAYGLLGGCATFLVSFIAVFICSADFAGLLGSTTDIDLNGGQVVPYLLLCSTIMALVFLVGFAIFASRKQKILSQEVSSRQRQVEEAIDEQQRSIADQTTKHLSLINEQSANQKLAVEKEVEAAKASLKKEISERQEQLDKHTNRVKI